MSGFAERRLDETLQRLSVAHADEDSWFELSIPPFLLPADVIAPHAFVVVSLDQDVEAAVDRADGLHFGDVCVSGPIEREVALECGRAHEDHHRPPFLELIRLAARFNHRHAFTSNVPFVGLDTSSNE